MEDLGKLSDFQLEDWAMNVDRYVIEHNMVCCCDEVCEAAPARELLATLTAERDRRVEAGEVHEDPNRLSLEERFAPYGPAWQEEQRDRW